MSMFLRAGDHSFILVVEQGRLYNVSENLTHVGGIIESRSFLLFAVCWEEFCLKDPLMLQGSGLLDDSAEWLESALLSELDLSAGTDDASIEIPEKMTGASFLDLQRVLAIGAHPDDIEMGCGGTIAKLLRSNATIKFLTLSGGEGGAFPDKRTQEARQAAQILGLSLNNVEILNFRDAGFTRSHVEIFNAIEYVAKAFKPTMVFTHPILEGDHMDHRTTGSMTLIAVRNLPCSILFYEPMIAAGRGFNPDVFFDITDSLELKISAVKAHISQKLSIDLIEAKAKVRGDQMYRRGERMAEAFKVYKLIL